MKLEFFPWLIVTNFNHPWKVSSIKSDKIFRVGYGCIFCILRKLVTWKISAWKHVSHASNKFSNTYQSYGFKRTAKYLVTLPNEGEGKVKLGAGILCNHSYHFCFSYTTLLDWCIWFLSTPKTYFWSRFLRTLAICRFVNLNLDLLIRIAKMTYFYFLWSH